MTETPHKTGQAWVEFSDDVLESVETVRTAANRGTMPRGLGFVTSAAAQLMEANASTATTVSEQVLARLVHLFDADTGFLRYNDQTIGASKLIAEWPPRPNRPHADLLAIVDFTSADDVFAPCAHGKEPLVIQPTEPVVIRPPAATNYAYKAFQRQTTGRRRVATPSMAAAPLVSKGVTTGVLGFVNFRGRKWKQEEVDTLGAVATLFAQLQARIAAEERLRYQAEHDDLTGLHNRRSVVAQLSERLAAGRPGPVAVLYLDLDRLKSINDYFGHAAGDFYLRVFAERLQASMEGLGTIGRIGGDEFLVFADRAMLTGTAESLAHRLQTTLRGPLKIGDDVITPSVSIGMAEGRPGRDDSADLLRRADEAALTAKRAGGNQVAMCTTDISRNVVFRKDIMMMKPTIHVHFGTPGNFRREEDEHDEPDDHEQDESSFRTAQPTRRRPRARQSNRPSGVGVSRAGDREPNRHLAVAPSCEEQGDKGEQDTPVGTVPLVFIAGTPKVPSTIIERQVGETKQDDRPQVERPLQRRSLRGRRCIGKHDAAFSRSSS